MKKLTKSLFVLLILVLLVGTVSCVLAVGENTNPVTAAIAIQKLNDGNQRFVDAKFLHPNQTTARRIELVAGQQPFAVILTCSDSRLPPEIIFDQGLGDLFVVRIAGNVVDDAVLGSVEYAVEHLGVTLVMVLGHERCGAVGAAVSGAEIPVHINSLTNAIKPALKIAKTQNGDLLDNTIRANVALVVQQFNNSKPILAEFVHDGKLKVVGAYYDMDDGTVRSLE
ncbi:MAG: carbonic anhydrase [Negativicutes bacterium]|jgi:carbonic anhydrase